MNLCALALASTLALLAAGALTSGEPPVPPAPPAEEAAAVVATVNGEPLYLEDVAARLEEMHGQVGETRRSDFDLDALMFRLVNDTLIAQEARALELDREAHLPERIETRRRELAVSRLEAEEVWSKAEVADGEVRAAFDELYRRVTLRVATTYEREEAEALLAELGSGADFEALARERSKDPYAARGGLVESLPRADLQRAVAEAAFGLEPDVPFGPVSTDIGWAVLEVVGFEPPDEERFEPVRREIRDTVRFRKAEAAREALGRLLRERHPVAIDLAVVAGVSRERLPDGRLVARPADPAAAVATVGTAGISAEAYARALQLRWAGVRNEAAAEAAAPIVLERMVGEELLAAETLARGYGEAPEVLRELHAYETRLLVARYLDDVLAPGIEVTPEEMRAYYEEHRDGFRRPPRVHLAQITLDTAPEAGRIAALAREGADFAWLARRHSTDTLGKSGGDKGWVEPRPGIDAFNDAVLEAPVGEVLDPVPSGESFVVYKVTAREERGVYGFEEISGNVRQVLYGQKAAAAIDALVRTLRLRSEIVVHDELLGQLAIRGTVYEEEKAPGGMMGAHAHGES